MQFRQQISMKAAAPVPRREEPSAVPAIDLAIQLDFLEGALAQVGRLWDVSSPGAWLWFLFQQLDGPAAPQAGLSGLRLVIRG